MPAEFLIAAEAALGVFGKLAASDVYQTSKKKAAGALSTDGPMARPLRKAFSEALNGFRDSLAASFPMDKDTEAGLIALAQSPEFAAAVGALPLVPFKDIDTSRLRELFQALGPKGADDGDFGSAWKALGRRFLNAAAETPELKNLIDLSYAARQEEREEVKQEKFAAIEELLERLVQNAEASGRPRDPEPIVQEYRAALYRYYRFADTRGLFMREKEGVGEGIELRDVFVETPLGRLVEPKGRKKEAGLPAEPAEISAQQTLAEAAPVQEKLRFGEVIGRERLTVVLGSPGSGKSTLLRALVLTLCRPEGVAPILEHGLEPETVPVLLDLKEFASALRQTANLDLERFLFEKFEGKLPNLENLLSEGKAVVLMDGLDEVFDEAHRRWVSDEAWRLVTNHPNARFVLTSRPHGYRAAPLPGPVVRWQLQSFSDEDIGRFFRGWFEALAREGGEAGVDEPPAVRAQKLTKEVLANPRLKEMAQNPLLCTLIVLVHRSRSGRLPQRRVVFYEAAVRTLVEVWERMKHYPVQRGEERLEFPEPEILIRAMAEIAWRAFHELESREIPGDRLRQWLREYLEREPEWRGEKGNRAVRDLLQLVGDRTGLLVDLGGDRYQFVHLSLHEYLASYFLLDRLTEAQRAVVLRHYLHAPQWEEALRLLIAGAPQAQADILARSVLAEPSSNLEGNFRRDLRFLCRCLADLAPMGPEVRREIDEKIAEALENCGLADLEGFLLDVMPIGIAERDRPLKVLLHRLADEDLSALRLIVAALGPVAEAQSVWQALLARLGHEDLNIRFLAVEALRSVAGEPDVRSALLARLGDEDLSARSSAVTALSSMAGEADVRSALLMQLGNEASDVRSSAVEALRSVAGEADVRSALLTRLGDEDSDVRSSAVQALKSLASEPDVLSALLARFGDEVARVRSFAVTALRSVAGEPDVRSALLARLGDETFQVRSSAVAALRSMAGEAEVRSALLARFGDEAFQVRSSAVAALSSVAGEAEVRSALLARLEDEASDVRSSAVEALNSMAGEADVRSALLVRLEDEASDVRSSAVAALSSVAGEAEIRSALLARLEDEDFDVRTSAVEALSSVAGEPDVWSALRARLGDEDFDVRTTVVEALSSVAGEPDIREALLALVEDDDATVRRTVAVILIRTGFQPEIAQHLLSDFAAISSMTLPEDDKRFSLEVGRLAAADSELREMMMSTGRSLLYFSLGAALQTMLAEWDRLRRLAKPLRLPVPGCDVGAPQ